MSPDVNAMQFLCPHHRQQLRRQPAQTRQLWRQWMYAGAQARTDRRWREAVVYSGCSFNLAEELLAMPEQVVPQAALYAIDFYWLAAQQLADCLAATGQHAQELHVLLTQHRQLLASAKTRRYQQYSLGDLIAQSLQRLHRYAEYHGHFRGYRDCCEETLAVMARRAV